MALEFYSQDNSLIDHQKFLEYMNLEPGSLRLIDTFTQAEFGLLGPWVERCRNRGLLVGHYYDDTALHYEELGPALKALEQVYHELTGRSVFGEDHEVPNSAYRKMARVIRAALADRRGLIGLCD